MTYKCKNCGKLHYGRTCVVVLVGKTRVKLGPCCYKPLKPAPLQYR